MEESNRARFSKKKYMGVKIGGKTTLLVQIAFYKFESFDNILDNINFFNLEEIFIIYLEKNMEVAYTSLHEPVYLLPRISRYERFICSGIKIILLVSNYNLEVFKSSEMFLPIIT